MSTPQELKNRLEDVLTWRSAHADLERVVKNVPPDYRGRQAEGIPHTLWQLLEHIRIAQADILEYCSSTAYATPEWPEGFWPSDTAPPTREAWQESIDSVRRDRQQLIQLLDEVDVLDHIPHAEEHSYLRELLLVADHTAYHVGQMVLLRRILGIWPP